MNSIKHEIKLLQLPSYQYQQEAKELQRKLQLQSQEIQYPLLMLNWVMPVMPVQMQQRN